MTLVTAPDLRLTSTNWAAQVEGPFRSITRTMARVCWLGHAAYIKACMRFLMWNYLNFLMLMGMRDLKQSLTPPSCFLAYASDCKTSDQKSPMLDTPS
jgi:hypothetical protein